MNFTLRFRPSARASPKTTVCQAAHETIAEARQFAQGYARRLLPGTEIIHIESDDGLIRERWIWLNGQWERDDLI